MKNTINLNVSKKSFELLDPNLHDGTLMGIGVPSDGIVKLLVQDVNQSKYLIKMDGVSEFNATGLRQGNIILSITVIKGADVKPSYLSLLRYDRQSDDNFDRYINLVYQRILTESLYVVQLVPSYGCELIAVAREISIEEGWQEIN